MSVTSHVDLTAEQRDQIEMKRSSFSLNASKPHIAQLKLASPRKSTVAQSMRSTNSKNRVASAKQVREEKLSSFYDNDYGDTGILGGTGQFQNGRLMSALTKPSERQRPESKYMKKSATM